MPDRYEYDLFISYSRSKAPWVREHLAEPLNSCRTPDGRVPKVFIDTESLALAANFLERITECIQKSAVVLLVFSRDYFESKYCHFEAQQAFGRDPVGAQMMALPLLTDAPMEELNVHPAYRHFNALDTRGDGWFDKLLQNLGWRLVGKVNKLRFLSGVTEATAGETLPELRVAIECDGERVDDDQVVTLLSERSTLQGTTSAPSRHGVAVFNDLFLDSPVEATRLVATADGCSAIFSEPFRVKPPRAIETTRRETLLPHGEPVFLADSAAVAIVGDERVRVFDLAGNARGAGAAVPASVRFRRIVHGGLLLCGWHSEVVWIGGDGTAREWILPPSTGYHIAGDACAAGDDILLGFWPGDVYRLSFSGDVRLELKHAGGVQALAASNGDVFVADLDGFLVTVRGATVVPRMALEPTIRALKLFPQSLVIVGERKMYTLALATKHLVDVSLPIGLAAALDGGERIVAVAGDGKGVVIDERLALQVFHAWPGAVPRSLDGRAAFCVFRNPDRSSSLLHGGRIVLHHPAGALAVSPSGEWVAAEEAEGVRIVPARSLVPSGGAGA